MLYVTSLDEQQIEPLIKFNNFKLEQDIKGTFKIDFNSFQASNNPAHDILAEESIVTVDDFDFRVKQIKKTRTTKQVTALSTFYDLYDKRQNTIYGGTRTFNEFASFVFNSTGWTFTSNVTGSKFIPNFGENNIIALVNTLCNTYECEYQILPNNRIHFTNAIGGDYDFQYRYGHNVKALSEQVDTSNLKTQITGYGSGGLIVTYTSPNASTFGLREAEPIVDERYTQADSMIERLKEELIDYPEVSIELDTVDLLNRELGERVWLIYEPLNIEFQTRIQSQTKQFINNQLVTTKVVLGNAQIKTIYDVLASQSVKIDENNKITRSRFEQTNDKITMEVEQLDTSIAAIDLKADNINLSVNNRITNEVAAIDLRANQIQLSVDDARGNIASLQIQANQIQSTVSSQNTQIGNMQSTITQMSGEIDLMVKDSDLTGNELISRINLTSTTASIQASKINLVGAVTVLSDLSGNLGTITAGTINGTNINSANINISEDVKVGNNIQLGSISSYDTKSITFNSMARITGGTGFSGGGITVSAAEFNLSSVGFNRGYVKSETAGLEITRHSTDNKLLAVKVDGTWIGDLRFE